MVIKARTKNVVLTKDGSSWNNSWAVWMPYFFPFRKNQWPVIAARWADIYDERCAARTKKALIQIGLIGRRAHNSHMRRARAPKAPRPGKCLRAPTKVLRRPAFNTLLFSRRTSTRARCDQVQSDKPCSFSCLFLENYWSISQLLGCNQLFS